MRTLLSTALLILLLVPSGAARGQELPPRPADLTAFEIPAAPEAATVLSDYLWRHFHLRGGNGTVLFNKEYMTTADLWLGNARERGSDLPIQAVHRRDLLAIEMDDEGYVLTHQHFSHAHDDGWPFPLWTQVEAGTGGAGWHFQALESVPGWVGDSLRHHKAENWCGTKAAEAWSLHQVTSGGIVDNRWQIEAAGPEANITSPEGVTIDAFQSPFVQVRWRSAQAVDPSALPYLEWRHNGQDAFDASRRMTIYPESTPLSPKDQFHSILALHRHPEWTGKIAQLRLVFPGMGTYSIDSIFTAYDTRHTINNPVYILACTAYFNATGDLDFLRRVINPMRIALRYQQTVLGGLERNFIHIPWPGHDGRAGFEIKANGDKRVLGGHGIGGNYWDLLPFGADDAYATNQYYASTLAMAGIEEAVRANPGWDLPLGALAHDPAALHAHAAQVKETANTHFWNEETGRFAANVDADGKRWDYGFTFLNLDAIWYGLASDEHARSIMSWLEGDRIIGRDTSSGDDIYHWRFGPRATTRRNIEWYGFMWYAPESIPWGGQVQDGGAVLGFTFYDLWARLKVVGPDNAWQRLSEIVAWEKEVHAAGGYRAYYADGKQGTTLQGGGTAGGIGIDHEFYESSLLPTIIPLGFLGITPGPGVLYIAPRLPVACPEMRVTNYAWHGGLFHIAATPDTITVEIVRPTPMPTTLSVPEGWRLEDGGANRMVWRKGA